MFTESSIHRRWNLTVSTKNIDIFFLRLENCKSELSFSFYNFVLENKSISFCFGFKFQPWEILLETFLQRGFGIFNLGQLGKRETIHRSDFIKYSAHMSIVCTLFLLQFLAHYPAHLQPFLLYLPIIVRREQFVHPNFLWKKVCTILNKIR